MPTYGINTTAGYGTAASGQLRGSVYGVWPDNAWVTSISARLGRTPSGGNPSVRMGLYDTANGNPNNLRGQTAAFTVNNAMDWGGGSVVYTQSFQGGALRVSAGGNYAIGIVGTGASLNHAMVAAANSSFTNRNFYYRSGVTGSLPSPFGYTSSSYEGNISAWVDYTVNRAPTASTTSPDGLQTSTSVTLKGGFSDPDSGFGDRMHSYELELWNHSTNTRIWTTGWRTATSSESTNNSYSYAVTVPAGVSLRFRARVRDQFQTASAWTGWRYFNVHLNRKPTATTSVPTGLQTSTTVNFQGTFTDPDTSITGDTFSRFQFQVRNDNTNGTAHDSGELTPNSSEISNKRFTRNLTLTAGVPYSWRTRVRDNKGAWSDYTAWRTFTINAGGAVDTLSGVGGKQNSIQPTPFTAIWRHANNLNCNRFQHRIKQNGTVIRTGAEISTSTAVNGSLGSSWASAFGTYSLPWGAKNLTWEIRARDTANTWSSWSAGRAFHINTAPNLPTNLSPSNSAASPDRPLLRCRATDDDSDTLTVKARIKSNTGTVLQTRTMTHVGDGWYEYQTIAADLPDWGTFRWDARASDGTLWSGTQTAEANAQHSSEAVFIYAAVPNVALTSPLDEESYEGTVLVSWLAIPNQQAWRIDCIDLETGVHVVDSAWNTNTSNSYTITASQWGLRKGKTYQLFVELRDTNGLVGTSSPLTFTIDYPTPNSVEDFVALPDRLGVEETPSTIRMTWKPYEGVDFIRYVITRYLNGVPRVLTSISNAQETEFTDYIAPTEEEVEYSIILVTMQGIDELYSEPVSSVTSISIDNVILQSVFNPSDHVSLQFVEDRDFEHIHDGVEVLAWGAEAPSMVFGTSNYQRVNATFLLMDGEFYSARHQLDILRNLWRSRKTLCYRDERGRRLFGSITSFSEVDSRIGTYEVQLEIVQTQYEEGMVA